MRTKISLLTTIAASVLLAAACGDEPFRPIDRPVASVVVAPDTSTLFVGATKSFHATPRAAGGELLYGRTVAWTSEDESIARVTAAGIVTAVGAGTTRIVAASEGQFGYARVTVAPQPLAQLIILGDSVRPLERGQSQMLIAIGKAADGSDRNDVVPTWTSSDAAVASVGSTGGVMAMRGGSTVITATAEGKSASVRVRVPQVSWIDVLPKGGSMDIGGTLQASAVVHTEAGPRTIAVAWASENENIARIDALGRITALNPGIAVIRASAEDVAGRVLVTVRGTRWLTLASANGEPVPIAVRTTLWIDPNGVTRWASMVLEHGGLELTENGRYVQRLYVRYMEDNTQVGTGMFYDSGTVHYNIWTGEPILMSDVQPGRRVEGSWEHANGYPTGGVKLMQQIGGDGPEITLLFRQ